MSAMEARVNDLMSHSVQVVTPETGFREVVHQLETRHISALPVVDQAGKLVGIVSEADLLLKEEGIKAGHLPDRSGERRKADGTIAADLMTSPVITIGPEASPVEAARLMRKRKVKRLPVVDEEGHVVGIVSRADLLKVFLKSDEEIANAVRDAIGALWMDASKFHVGVTEGVVTVRGQLEWRSWVHVLEDVLSRIEGVVGLHSQLTYHLDDSRHRPSLRDRWFDPALADFDPVRRRKRTSTGRPLE